MFFLPDKTFTHQTGAPQKRFVRKKNNKGGYR